MADNKGATVRRNIRNTSEPMELRELNRQMEWIWRKLLGGLDDKAFSDSGFERVTTKVENVITEDIVAGTIDANMLTAALANLMVAVIGVCDADYLHAVDAEIDQLIVRRGYGESFTFDNLRIIYAQIVDAMIGDLIIQASDGKYYQLDVDSEGNVTATDVTVTDGEVEAGQTENGQVILGTDIVAEELSTHNLAATFALIAQIDADRINVDKLVAREAFMTALFASEAFIEKLKAVQIYGENTLEFVAQNSIDAMDAASEANDKANEVAGQLDDFVTKQHLSTYMRLISGTAVTEDRPAGVYVGLTENGETARTEAVINASGSFEVRVDNAIVSSLGNKIQTLGSLTIYETADGGHAFI